MKHTQLLPPIDKKAHAAFKAWCNLNGVTMTRKLEALIVEHLAAHPAEGITITPAPVVMQEAHAPGLVGRPPKQKPFQRCPRELAFLALPAKRLLELFEEMNPKPVHTITLRFLQQGKYFEPYGLSAGQPDEVTNWLGCMANASEGMEMPIVDGVQYEALLKFNGMESVVQVRAVDGAYTPMNELARMLMKLYPGRVTFDLLSLHFFSTHLKFLIEFV